FFNFLQEVPIKCGIGLVMIFPFLAGKKVHYQCCSYQKEIFFCTVHFLFGLMMVYGMMVPSLLNTGRIWFSLTGMKWIMSILLVFCPPLVPCSLTTWRSVIGTSTIPINRPGYRLFTTSV